MNLRPLTLFLLLVILCLTGVEQASAFYNPGTGRWLSKDPIEEQGGVNTYGFIGNRSIDRFDALGKEPWVEYETPEIAAMAALVMYNKLSVAQNKEMGGLIYKTDTGKYFHTPAIVGTARSVNVVKAMLDPYISTLACQEVVADFHTHAAYAQWISKVVAQQEGLIDTINNILNSLFIPAGDLFPFDCFIVPATQAEDASNSGTFHGFHSDEFSLADQDQARQLKKQLVGYKKSFLFTPSGRMKTFIP